MGHHKFPVPGKPPSSLTLGFIFPASAGTLRTPDSERPCTHTFPTSWLKICVPPAAQGHWPLACGPGNRNGATGGVHLLLRRCNPQLPGAGTVGRGGALGKENTWQTKGGLGGLGLGGGRQQTGHSRGRAEPGGGGGWRVTRLGPRLLRPGLAACGRCTQLTLFGPVQPSQHRHMPVTQTQGEKEQPPCNGGRQNPGWTHAPWPPQYSCTCSLSSCLCPSLSLPAAILSPSLLDQPPCPQPPSLPDSGTGRLHD